MSNISCATQRFSEDEDEGEESLAEKLNDLISGTESEVGSDSEENFSEDVIEIDENGRVRDFELIADALESKKCENKTFTDMELRDIERKNSILMHKIMSNNRRPSQYTPAPVAKKVSSSSINRRQKQAQIDRENMILLRKIQSVKPFGMSKNKK